MPHKGKVRKAVLKRKKPKVRKVSSGKSTKTKNGARKFTDKAR